MAGVGGSICTFVSYHMLTTRTDLQSFLIEGTITFFIGVLSFGLMPPGACQTKHWFRGKNGWFNEHEEKILVNRILRDDPSKGDMNNRYDARMPCGIHADS
jgi:hypothetical protein